MFIVFEGSEGTGKTTQIKLLEELFLSQGRKVFLTKEPGGSNNLLGQKLRDILLHSEEDISQLAELALYMADRSQHISMIVKPKLEAGYVVLCDRYVDSTVAYQSYGRQIDLDLVNNLNKIFSYDLKPDATIYLDIDTKLGLTRARKVTGDKHDRFESLDLSFHDRVRSAYLDLQKVNDKSVLIKQDENSTIESVFLEIKKYLEV